MHASRIRASTSRHPRWRACVRAGIFCGILLCVAARCGAAAPDPATTFTRRCRSCHTFGHGILVGPDLKGVTDRHRREWLLAWIASSEGLIRSGDAAATTLFNQFQRQRMPDQDLSRGELAALLDYLAAGGPDADARAHARGIETATAAEIEMGRLLFVGRRPLANGGASCFACHRLGDEIGAGGTLGPDLARAYARYQDRGLTAILGRGCFPRARPAGGLAARPTPLTEPEAFALRAFLRREMKAER